MTAALERASGTATGYSSWVSLDWELEIGRCGGAEGVARDVGLTVLKGRFPSRPCFGHRCVGPRLPTKWNKPAEPPRHPADRRTVRMLANHALDQCVRGPAAA